MRFREITPKYLLTTISLLLTILLLTTSWPVSAQSALTPAQAAKSLQDALFEAQVALQQDNFVASEQHLTAASQLFIDNLWPTLAIKAPEASNLIRTQLDAVKMAIETDNPQQLAVLRGQIRAELLAAAYRLTIQGLTENEATLARSWLLLRVYRPATRFSRPNADATLAVEAFYQAEISTGEALTAVQADLLDTYQAELNRTLEAVQETTAKNFQIRQAELIGLVQGYWLILQPAYQEQFGAEAATQVTERFESLLHNPDPATLNQTINGLHQTLQTFRAAPLSETEQARRAAQLLRFLKLVPVEYQRGVSNGEVFLALEVQEAITFLAGAKAAFDDLQLPLQAINADLTAEVTAQLTTLEDHLEAANQQTTVVDPVVIEATVTELTDHLQTLLPEAWQQTNSNADFDVIASVLDRMEQAVANGDYESAEAARLEAYAIFDFGPELRLLAFAPDMVAEADGLFWHGYNDEAGLAAALADQNALPEIKAVRANLDETLHQSQRILGDVPSSPMAIIFNAAIIVFREGLEAVVILAALMASLVGAYATYRRPMIWGAVLAFIATIITWLIAQQILLALGGAGEKLEAVVSLLAIGVLLLITNWFFHKVYWKDWLKNFHSQKKQILSGQAGQFIGLIMLGFTSIYREGFETVLFLQALVLDAGSVVVLEGVALGLAAVGIVGFITFKLQQTLPYKKMLVVTGILIGGVLLVMVGHTMHILQAVGWMTINPIQGVSIPYQFGLWFGLYPTWEGFIAQIAAGTFVIGSYYLAEYSQHHKKQVKVASNQSPLSN